MKRILSLFAATLVLSACPGGGDGSGSDAPLCPEPEELSGTITTEVIVGEECRNVFASQGVTVANGGTLRIAPGTTITFGSGAALMVNQGTVIAEGTESAPIVFTGQDDIPGFWQGLVFYRASSTQNVLSHVVVEFAGGSKYTWASIAGGLVLVGSEGQQSRVKVSDSRFHRNAGVGVAVHEHCVLSDFSRNEMTENVDGAAYTHVSTASQLTPSNVYTGNQNDRVHLAGNQLSTEAPLHNLEVPFRAGAITVASGGKLSIEPGVRVRFTSNGQILLNDGGRLEAVGTAAAPIRLEGDETVPGFWNGIIVYRSGSTENALDHVFITDAGGAKHTWAAHAASVTLSSSESRLHMSNTVIDRGEGFALHLDPDAEITGFSNNTLTGHALGAAYAGPLSVKSLSRDSTYTGNATGRDFVLIADKTLTAAATWKTLDVPYLLSTVKVGAGGDLTIEPGNTLKFQGSGGLETNDVTARISAVGTAAAPIIFTRADDAASWRGLHIYRSTALNRLEHVELSFGGQSKYTWANNAATLSVANGRLELSNVRITNSVAYGLDIKDDSTVTGCASVIYEGNASGNQSGTGTCG